MFRLPRTAPPEIRSLLERELGVRTLDQVLIHTQGTIQRLFNAQDSLLLFRSEDTPHASGLRLGNAASSREQVSAQCLEELPLRWEQAGIHHYIAADLRTQLSCISYSAFSWPYPSITLSSDSSAAQGRVPRDYTLLIPISSELTVHHEEDSPFFGYIALMFDAFPQLPDSTVQLIITLPELLSDVVAAHLRQPLFFGERARSSFAHDAKRKILVLREYLLQLRQAPQSEHAEQLLESMGRVLGRMQQEVSSVMLLDRMRTGQLKIHPILLSLSELAAETVSEVAPLFQQGGVTIQTECEEGLPATAIDPAIFPAAIENLLDNALKFSERGQTVILRTRLNSEGQIVLEVCDQGKGVRDEEREAIFAPYFRGEAGDGVPGHGLGLYMVRKIVEAHRGVVSVSSGDEAKTTFSVTLPRLTSGTPEEGA